MKKTTSLLNSVRPVLCTLVCLLSLCFACSALADALSDISSTRFTKVWKNFSDISTEAMEIVLNSDKNSKTALEMLTFREPRYVRLLQKAQKILENTEVAEKFSTIDELILKNKLLENDIVQLSRERITAPSSSNNPFTTTKSRIDKKIKDKKSKKKDNEEAIDIISYEIVQLFANKGINISYDQVRYFIISADGPEFVRIMNIATNMKSIQIVIEQELQRDRNNVELAKYYSGMYLICLETYSAAHDVALENIKTYRERLEAILGEARRNRNEASQLTHNTDHSDLGKLETNISINNKIIEVGLMYKNVLTDREQKIKESKANVQRKVHVAENTYKTIANGTSLISLVHTSSDEFSLLSNFDIPELKMIYDTGMLNAFMEISSKIKRQ